jgi:hypothetical protein
VPRPLGTALIAVVDNETVNLDETENSRPICRRIKPENGFGNRAYRQQESQQYQRCGDSFVTHCKSSSGPSSQACNLRS